MPALLDHWSFVAFEGVNGQIVQKEITVIGSESGAVIGHAGMVETVTQLMPDEDLVKGLDNPEHAAELEASAMFTPDDVIRLTERVSDPEQTMVPNTSCSSCHRLNHLRFDLHNLSHLEDRDLTISPRVDRDVAHELRWLRSALGR